MRGKYGKKYLYKGEYYYLTELERMSGIRFQTLKQRIVEQGMTPEEAITIPVKKYRRFFYHGELYTRTELAEIANVACGTLRYRMDVKGMTAEQAVDMPKSTHGKKSKLPKGCKYPDCFNCILNDCVM